MRLVLFLCALIFPLLAAACDNSATMPKAAVTASATPSPDLATTTTEQCDHLWRAAGYDAATIAADAPVCETAPAAPADAQAMMRDRSETTCTNMLQGGRFCCTWREGQATQCGRCSAASGWCRF